MSSESAPQGDAGVPAPANPPEPPSTNAAVEATSAAPPPHPQRVAREEREDADADDDLFSEVSLRSEDPLHYDPQGGRHASSDELIEDNAELTEHLAHGTYDHDAHDAHLPKDHIDGPQTSADDLLQHGAGGGSADSLPYGCGLKSHPSSPQQRRPPRVNLLHLFNRQNIKVSVVPIIGGLISGYTIAVVPVYTQLFVAGTNCALYTAQKGCESVPFADCMWRTATVTRDDGTTQSLNYCGWPAITCRATYPNDGWMGGGGNTTLAEMRCLQDSRCTWSYSAKECQNPNGYTIAELGVFAGSMIAGNMFGAILGGPLVTSMGARLTFIVSGFFSVVTSIMGHADALLNDFWVLASSRFVLGIFMGLITVACPLYVHENADPFYKPKMGLVFQVFATVGSFLGAVVGIGVGETIDYAANASQHISARMQGITAGQTLLAILLFLLGVFCADSKVKFKKGVEGALNQNEYSYWKMAPRLMMVIALNATFRFTGFNALANFGPKLMSSFNVAPFLGVFIILTVNCAGGLVSMPASLFVSPKTLFLFGSCFISCMCLFLCGIPVYPGVASASVTNTCAVVGICLYIFTYEVFVGPSFYVLCQDIFPPSFRPRGNSFAQLWQFIFNLVINVCYSIAVVSFSGGPEGDQHKGQAVIFIFFGALGLVLFVYEFFCLDLWDTAAEAERKRKAAEKVPTIPNVTGDSTSNQMGVPPEDLNSDEVEMRV
ncbi:glucose transporter lmgt2 [Leptomonas pyrrhocoris]|uniref:Glucose transporter lmgt2 n=1 Tax=Leptomonas pyrrhocoris TaxID=157538 RepID=A0A0N0DTS8_LEPPY|nr:glucose transporter lmgt2 [Leptomonas pyrrhocoris]XP_015656287.1 glucose transporter lmgt2 [Leptomonas pyrrhocoris]XP_015656288.1 glucose transporter lmgt2 [Leptomonas pyrrhocoris]KPA77847.1 glucose transporter lmgt2 [Leptomonas pyrrhocoris]KPA77848.1 glucose transporter lmgt2 [Leptomonas pyrrhocoris]KPA77849.1 glucose transporter lmgt2 [Leptomonas pyrrhocoris]|eukprot:XP_015656286.1 glucose transporter lmgt2 [Leptomonas pyrrhocoris]